MLVEEAALRPPDFELAVTRRDRAAVVRVSGELDLATGPDLHTQVVGLVDQGVRHVAIDLAELDFIDSTGLRVLVTVLKRMAEEGGRITLHRPTLSTMKVLELTGLTELFVVTETPASTGAQEGSGVAPPG